MGVPAFFRWLSRKYPSIVSFCVETKPNRAGGEEGEIDITLPNPNGIEIDYLYLDMNGIIHPCTHPEDKSAPPTELDMFQEITKYIDRIINIVRPRKLVYFAIDGVAPRAKMNQQRSRRFRSSRDLINQQKALNNMRDMVKNKGYTLPEPVTKSTFDSNCITPGTDFMHKLSQYLVGYITERLNNNPGWKDLVIIHSDASVPGEGEHKIMDFIRRQRADPSYNPNMVHCIYGADADLIMLGLATHEPNFLIIRENFKPFNQDKPCPLCYKLGHKPIECKGLEGHKDNDEPAPTQLVGLDDDFIFIRISVLREYLRRDFFFSDESHRLDFERMIDDWVLICFLVGNDFLPHLPSLEIREGAIDRLWNLYQGNILKMNGYLCDSGRVNMDNFKLILSHLGTVEDSIFQRRAQRQKNYLERRRSESGEAWTRDQGILNAQTNADKNQKTTNLDDLNIPHLIGKKRHHSEMENPEKAVLPDVPYDPVKLGEEGWKQRYYQNKFKIEVSELDEYRSRLAKEYLIGVSWVLQYYYQGCSSWNWSYPFHYAPFASDFNLVSDVDQRWNHEKDPFLPYEQLMAVLPESSKALIPSCFHPLMTSQDSAIIDFYPKEFMVDLNGKLQEWQGVALLPFIDQTRLRESMKKVVNLSDYENQLNSFGESRILLKDSHVIGTEILGNAENLCTDKFIGMKDLKVNDIFGQVKLVNIIQSNSDIQDSVKCKVNGNMYENILCLYFCDPIYASDMIFKSRLLPQASYHHPKESYVPILNFPESPQTSLHVELPGRRYIQRVLPRRHAGDVHLPSNIHTRHPENTVERPFSSHEYNHGEYLRGEPNRGYHYRRYPHEYRRISDETSRRQNYRDDRDYQGDREYYDSRDYQGDRDYQDSRGYQGGRNYRSNYHHNPPAPSHRDPRR